MKKKKTSIALFRYGLIAPALHMSLKERKDYFKLLQEKEFDVPLLGIKRYKAGTLKNWLNRYKKGGFEQLAPLERCDAGATKRIGEQAEKIIAEIIDQNPYLSISGIYRMMLHQEHIQEEDFGETTLRNYIKKHQLIKEHIAQPRKKFEKASINELWMADFMEGPYLLVGKKKKKTYLCACIEDHSRLIVGAGWFFQENSIALASVLKKAFAIYGLPDSFYCDNGSAFRTNYLHLVCARLGIALIHSRPYDSPSRGKIERYFRTTRTKFLACLHIAEVKDIEHLNTLFEEWLEKDYHQQFHYGITTRPIDAYLKSAESVSIRRISSHELDDCFLGSMTRKVKNDATLSIRGTLYEAPVEYIGKIVEICFPIDAPDKLTLYDNEKPVCLLRPVNASLNATKPYTGIHFNK
jgi:transposase InsO family protein